LSLPFFRIAGDACLIIGRVPLLFRYRPVTVPTTPKPLMAARLRSAGAPTGQQALLTIFAEVILPSFT
jgi:hypothetical protein